MEPSESADSRSNYSLNAFKNCLSRVRNDQRDSLAGRLHKVNHVELFHFLEPFSFPKLLTLLITNFG